MPEENQSNELLRESEVTNIKNYIHNQPGWVRQYYFYSLYERSLKLKSKKIILIQELKPQPTSNFYVIRKENFESPLIKLNVHEIVFLECVDKGRNFIEICCDKQWSLTKCCNIYLSLIAKQLISYPVDRRLLMLIDHILGRITLEEYLVRTKKITIKQLNNVMYAQKRTLEETGESPSVREMLIKLKYMKAKVLDDLYLLTSSADKPCMMEDKNIELNREILGLKEEIARLRMQTINLTEDNVSCKDLLMKKSANILELTNKLNKRKSFFL